MIESVPRREREVFEMLCRLGEATAFAVRMPYVYAPAPQTEAVAQTALQRIVRTFFRGVMEALIAARIDTAAR